MKVFVYDSSVEFDVVDSQSFKCQCIETDFEFLEKFKNLLKSDVDVEFTHGSICISKVGDWLVGSVGDVVEMSHHEDVEIQNC